MSADRRVPRREVLRAGATGLLALTGLTACGKKEFACNDTSSLAAADAQARAALGYVEPSPDAAKDCASCQQFVRASADGCGSCKIVKGPIHPKGYCKAYAKGA